MRQARRWIAVLLAAVLLLGAVPAMAEEGEEPRPEELSEALPEDPAENLAEEPSEEPPEGPAETPPPEEEPSMELLAETGNEGAGDDPSAVTVTNSDEFRKALKNEAVKTVFFEGHIRIEALSTANDNYLRAEEKKILPINGDYESNSLSFDSGVTLLQISPHEGNQPQVVEDQSISLIYGMAESGESGNEPDLDRLTGFVPGTVGWYEYHAKKEENPADPYAGMRVCYTLYCGNTEDALRRAGELTAGYWEHEKTNAGDDYRLVFTIFGEDVTLGPETADSTDRLYIETDMFYVMQNRSLTIGSGGALRVRNHLEVQRDLTVLSGGKLDLSDWNGTAEGDGLDGKPFLNVWETLTVEPGGAVAFGTSGGETGGDVILGDWIPRPEKLDCKGIYVPCLAVKLDEEKYDDRISMMPGEVRKVTFALCEYRGANSEKRFEYTDLTNADFSAGELVLPTFLKENAEAPPNCRSLTAAADAGFGTEGEIAYTDKDGRTYTLPVRIENPAFLGLPVLGIYSKPEANWENYLEDWMYTPMDNTFYVCARKDFALVEDSCWDLDGELTVSTWGDGDDAVVPDCVTTENRGKGVWQVTVTGFAFHVKFSIQPKDKDNPDTPPATALWVETGEQLVYSKGVLAGDSPYHDSRETLDRVLTDSSQSQLSNALPLAPGGSADVVLYLLRYDDGSGPDIKTPGWICEHTSPEWAEGWDGVFLNRIPEEGKDAFTRVTLRADCADAQIVRLGDRWVADDEQNPNVGHYEPDYESTRGIPLPVQVLDSGLFLTAVYLDENGNPGYGDTIDMTPYDEHEVTFALCRFNKETHEYECEREIRPADITVSGPLKYEEMASHGGKWTLRTDETADRNSMWDQVFQITYTEGKQAYTLPVFMNLPELGCYWGPEASRDACLRDWLFNPLDEANTFYVCVNPDAWFMHDENWTLPESLDVKAWQDGMDESGKQIRIDKSGAVSSVLADRNKGVWEVTVARPRINVEFSIALVRTDGEEDPNPPAAGTGLWIDAREWLVCSDSVLTDGESLDPNNPNDPGRTLTDANRKRLTGKLELLENTPRDVVLYLLVYDDRQERWTCEHTGIDWAEGRNGVTLEAAEDGLFIRLTASEESGSEGGPHVARLDGKEISKDDYEPVKGTTRGDPLYISVIDTSSKTMETSSGEKVEVSRSGEDGRTVEITSSTKSLSASSPLFAAGYDKEGRLISVTALTEDGSVRFQESAAWYRLIWADGNSAPKCGSIYGYLGVN